MAMIEELKKLCVARGIYMMYVQADHGDDPAIGLYTTLGVERMCFTSTSPRRQTPRPQQQEP